MARPRRRRPTLNPTPPKLRHRSKRRPQRDIYGRWIGGPKRIGGVPMPMIIGGIFAVGMLAGVGVGLMSSPPSAPQPKTVVAQAPVPQPIAPKVIDGRQAADLAAAEPAKSAKKAPLVVYEEPEVLAAPPVVAPEPMIMDGPETAEKSAPTIVRPPDSVPKSVAARSHPFEGETSPVTRDGKVDLNKLPPATRKAVLAAQRAVAEAQATVSKRNTIPESSYAKVDWTQVPLAPHVDKKDRTYEPVAMPAFPPKPWMGPGQEPWKKNAVPVVLKPGKPRIAIVIDDMGLDRVNTRKMINLPGPMTLAFLTYANDLKAQTRAAHQKGHELMVHMAMEPTNPDVDPGPDVLLTRWDERRIRTKMEELLSRFEGVVGLNNHMGSRFTADPYGMAVVLDVVRSKGLLFLDSRTSGKTVGPKIAENYGIPWAGRHVFLDNEPDPQYVIEQLNTLVRWAKQHGYAVGIGHPRDWTVKALAQWLPKAEAMGVQLVPISAIVRQRQQLAAAKAENLALNNQ